MRLVLPPDADPHAFRREHRTEPDAIAERRPFRRFGLLQWLEQLRWNQRVVTLHLLARLVVTDHGIGIDPARRAYVFERFERAVPSENYGGLGLGLYIARSIVLAHGGTITADSTLGVGSTFTVTLPCAAPERAAAAEV